MDAVGWLILLAIMNAGLVITVLLFRNDCRDLQRQLEEARDERNQLRDRYWTARNRLSRIRDILEEEP